MKKVLLIDDDAVITAVHEKHFRAAGFDVMVANGGAEGLRAVHDFRPDAVLLDLNMPEVSGVQWLVEVRKDPRFAQLPVVVYTAASIQWQVWAAVNSNVVFMFKEEGVGPRDIVKAINGALGMLDHDEPMLRMGGSGSGVPGTERA